MGRPLRWMLLIVVALIPLIAHPRSASADPLAKPTDPEALKHLEKGDAHYKIREFAEAIDEYKAGARIQASPRFLYNLGQAYRQLADYENAIWHFTQWIKTANPPDDMRSSIEKVITDLRVEQAKAPPPGEPDKDKDSNKDKEPDQAAPPVGPPAPPWYNDGLGWGLAGGGVVGIGVGALLFMNASGIDEDADGAEEEDRDALRDKASSRRKLGYIGTGVGVGLAIAGVVRLVLTPDAERQPSAGVQVTVGPRWIGVAGRF